MLFDSIITDIKAKDSSANFDEKRFVIMNDGQLHVKKEIKDGGREKGCVFVTSATADYLLATLSDSDLDQFISDSLTSG
jgi:hypothetical protein